MKIDMEQLLQQALSPEREPDDWLNQNILHRAKEKRIMADKKRRFSTATAAMVFLLLTSSIGVVAAVRYLTPEQVAESFSDELLSKAFQTEKAILVNETQEAAGYRITLLGMVSGEDLSEYVEWDEEGKIQKDKTYVVTAIENADGTPRPDVSDDAYGEDPFYVSPYVKGLSMAEYNAHTLGGGYSEDVIDGIQYRIMECDNVEMFAGRGLYLGVSDGSFHNADAFVMDEETGVIIRNSGYMGVNALFELPIPKEKGDEAAVEEYLREKEDTVAGNGASEETVDEEGGNMPAEVKEALHAAEAISETIKSWSLSDFEANAQCIYEEELTVTADGYIFYEYSYGDGGGSEAQVLVDMLFDEKIPGLSRYSAVHGSDPAHIETYELLENGNIKLRVFEYEMK